jgi:dTDP-glucose pyrophosphorylase
MNSNYKKHLVLKNTSIRQILQRLNELAQYAIAFVVDEKDRLVGSVTDGDIRRGFIKGLGFENSIMDFIQPNPYKLKVNELTPDKFRQLKEKLIKIVPIIDNEDKIIGVIHLDLFKSLLPLDAIIMAGGEGIRLRPLTLTTPKPLLKIGDKPIIEHLVDRLLSYGVFDFTISVKYLGEQIESYFGNGNYKDIEISYLREEEPLGTVGAITLKRNYKYDHVLLINSDILTDIDFEDMYIEFINRDADMIVATVPYRVTIPYGVIEFSEDSITSINEKPTYTYYSNAGIYMVKKECLDFVPKGQKFDATDLIELLVERKLTVTSYPILSYWLDIGKHEDYQKAQDDIKHIKF